MRTESKYVDLDYLCDYYSNHFVFYILSKRVFTRHKARHVCDKKTGNQYFIILLGALSGINNRNLKCS
jgi:hypothetical protein